MYSNILTADILLCISTSTNKGCRNRGMGHFLTWVNLLQCVRKKAQLWPTVQLLNDTFTLTAYGQSLNCLQLKQGIYPTPNKIKKYASEDVTTMLDIKLATGIWSNLSLVLLKAQSIGIVNILSWVQ